MSSQKSRIIISTSELGKKLRLKRLEYSLSLRKVEEITGVSASTLSRIENGTVKPDADTLAHLISWLNIPLARIVSDQQSHQVVYFEHESTPEIIEAHLRADANLTPETANALAELFRTAYKQFSKQKI
jgi:transcriptional regulator with XRE-family HTH domain